MRLTNDPIEIRNETYTIRIGDDRVKYEGQKLNEYKSIELNRDDLFFHSFSPFEKVVITSKEEITMSDALNLTGPDANMERETFLEEQKRAESVDSSKIQELLKATFVSIPDKTIDNMTDEEVLKHKYTLEEAVRLLRVHILTVTRSADKRRAVSGKKVFDSLDAQYKPKPIPESRKANDKLFKLAQTMSEELEITFEKAMEILKMKGLS